MSATVSISDELRIIYQEIIQGCSLSEDGKVVIRHLTEIDQIEILRYKLRTVNELVKEGIPTEKERLKILFENEEWTQDKEDRIISLRLTISDNEKNINKFIPQQQAGIRIAIEKDKEELIQMLMERRDMIGATADESSAKSSTLYALYLSLYTDRTCKHPMFDSFDSFERLYGDETDRYMDILNEALGKFQEHKIRQLSIMPFFLNNFSYSKENIHTFLQKPTVEFTSYQNLLFSLGQRNLNILSQTEGEPPEMFAETTPNDVLTWYDQQYSVIIGKRMAAKGR